MRAAPSKSGARAWIVLVAIGGGLVSWVIFSRDESRVSRDEKITVPAASGPTESAADKASDRGGMAVRNTAPSSDERETARASSFIVEAGSAIRRHLTDTRQFAKLEECRSQNRSECRGVLSRALRLALEMMGREAIFSRFWGPDGRVASENAYRAAEAILASSNDPAIRMSALELLDLAGTHDPRPFTLGVAAYTRLESMLESEQMLVLREYIASPSDAAVVADKVARIAESPEASPELRSRALHGLAKVGAREAVNRHMVDIAFTAFNDDAARALALCGAACSGAMQRMAKGNEASRSILLRTLGRLPPEQCRSSFRALRAICQRRRRSATSSVTNCDS